MPEKPWPEDLRTVPLYCTRMSSQYAKPASIAARDGGSARSRLPSVSSDSTMPKPKVSSGRLRSVTSIEASGNRFFRRIAEYRPAGPPPITSMRMVSSLSVPRPGAGIAPELL